MRPFVVYLIFILLASCTSKEKSSSSIHALMGDPDPKVEYKTIRENLSRYGHIVRNHKTMKGRAIRTGTWLKVYPFTKPLAVSRAKEDVEEKAFKEKWPELKKKGALQKSMAKIEKLDQATETCFLAEIHSNDSQARQTKYWYGTLIQGDKATDLKFSKGTGFSLDQTTTYTQNYNQNNSSATSTTYTTTRYYHYAQACAKTKTDFSQPFSLKIEPRYKMHLLPTEFVWEKPNEKPLNQSRRTWQ